MRRAINYPYTLDPVGVAETTEQANKIWLDRLLTPIVYKRRSTTNA